MSIAFKCSDCDNRACLKGGEYPPGCPSVTETNLIDSANERVSSNEEITRILAASDVASHQENGALNNRVEALIQFCRAMNYSTIGVAFCVAMAKEARVLCQRLSLAEFCVVPVCCKIGGNVGVDPSQVKGVACNPVAQAYVLNDRKTDINIAVGLCLGHDILFSQNSKSPVTTLVVKDRKLKHNTIVALQS